MPTTMKATSRQSDSLMTIGEAARRSGLTIKTLRFYERRGIVPPPSRRSNGYRVYCETDLDRLRFIRDAKALGLKLLAIGEILGVSNSNMRHRLLQVLDDSVNEATEQIAALTRLRNELERRRRTVARRRASDRGGKYCTCLKKTERGE
jgi:DNA-binding transcriptional MerR regulator